MTVFRAFCIIILGLTSSSVFAQNPSVETRLSKDTMELGERIDYSISVRHPAAQSIIGDPFVDFHDFEVTQIRKYEPEKSGGNVTERWQYTITTFRLDSFDIPPPRVALLQGRDTTVIEGMAKRLIVAGVLDTSIKDIQPEKPMIAGKVNWWLFALYVALILGAVAAIIYLIYRWWDRRRRKGEAVAHTPIIIRRPEEIALEQLENIKSKRLIDKGEFKIFNTEVSNVVRSYIEAKFNTLALEMPTSELMRHFQRQGLLDSTQFSTLRALLEVADLVKFAKYKPSPDECEDVMERAIQFIIRTSTPEPKPAMVTS